MGDLEYSLAFQNLIMPIAYAFNPELVLVSAGFDAAIGDQLGGCRVTPEAYGHFTHWLSALANGKIILCLEGGYNVNSISYAMTMCSKSLLGDPLPLLNMSSRSSVHSSCLETLKNVQSTQEKYWKCLKFNKKLPDFCPSESLDEKLVDGIHELSLGLVDADEGKSSDSSPNRVDDSVSNAGPFESSSTSTLSFDDFMKENMDVSFFFLIFLLSSFIILNQIFQALSKEEMFAVVPKRDCPHLSLLKPHETPSSKF